VRTVAVLTVSDSPEGVDYHRHSRRRWGAFGHVGTTFTLLLNHELPATSGAVRAHGQTGAFVSRWEIQKSDLRVLTGADQIQNATISTARRAAPSHTSRPDRTRARASS
jgi:hypothetical protein